MTSQSTRRSPAKALAMGVSAAAIAAALFLSPVAGGVMSAFAAPERMALMPAPAADDAAADGKLQTVVLSGGCFWGVQGVFQRVKGVRQAVSGYAGGAAATAIYEVVSSGATGHAESVKVVFDPKEVSLGTILQVFFSVATDPTQVNQQFPDHGTQYRSEIFYTTPEQKAVAEAYIAQLNKAKVYSRPIATRVDPLKGFYVAEGYHQNYLTLHPDQPYISTYDLPKVAALKKLFPGQYMAKPVLVGTAG